MERKTILLTKDDFIEDFNKYAKGLVTIHISSSLRNPKVKNYSLSWVSVLNPSREQAVDFANLLLRANSLIGMDAKQ